MLIGPFRSFDSGPLLPIGVPPNPGRSHDIRPSSGGETGGGLRKADPTSAQGVRCVAGLLCSCRLVAQRLGWPRSALVETPRPLRSAHSFASRLWSRPGALGQISMDELL